MTTSIDARLLQLASPALPVGAYSYSQGLEAAIEAGLVHDAASARTWIDDVLAHAVARLEAPAMHAMALAFVAGDAASAAQIDARFLAARESSELHAESLQMGWSLKGLLLELGAGEVPIEAPSYPAAYAWAVAHWGIAPRAALLAYLWSWAENQVMAALKAVPLGQTDGQRILLALGARLEALADAAADLPEEDWCGWMPRLALLSARHETQYSRLFRS